MVKDKLTSAAYAAGWTAVRRMPEQAARGTFRRLADRVWASRGAGVVQLEKNLRRVVGDEIPDDELRQLSKEAMRSYFRYWCEAFRLPELTPERVVETIRIVGDENLARALAEGRGVIVSLPHMGNWDHAGAWATIVHAPLMTVAERLHPESLYERFLDYRRSLGMDVLPLTGDGVKVFDSLAQRCREGGLVCLLGDRDLTASGVPVKLFGEATKMPAGPAALALETGALLLPATLWYDDTHTWVRVHEPVAVPETGSNRERTAAMTQAVADVFEGGIRQHPADWHMLQRLWLADRQRPQDPAQDGAV